MDRGSGRLRGGAACGVARERGAAGTVADWFHFSPGSQAADAPGLGSARPRPGESGRNNAGTRWRRELAVGSVASAYRTDGASRKKSSRRLACRSLCEAVQQRRSWLAARGATLEVGEAALVPPPEREHEGCAMAICPGGSIVFDDFRTLAGSILQDSFEIMESCVGDL